MESIDPHVSDRPPRRRRLGVVVGVAIFVLIAPALALANHQFNDVATGASYHDDVEALVGAGITSGCGGGNYCPGSAVNRGQMAQFLNRGLGISTSSTGTILMSEAGENLVATITIPAGAQSGGTGFVTLTADLMLFGAGTACPCGVTFGIADLAAKGVSSPLVSFLVPSETVNGQTANAASVSWTFEVPTGSDASFGLFASVAVNEPVVLGGIEPTGVTEPLLQGVMSAQYSPFGSASEPGPLGGELTGGVVEGPFGPIDLNAIGD